MEGKVFIKGAIGEWKNEEHTTLVDVITQVKKQPNATSFKVIIKSPGGYMKEGFDIYRFLKSLGVPIETEGQEIVASIATVIFMAGNKRSVTPGTKFMIHLPSGGIDGTADEIEDYLKSMRAAEKDVLSFYTTEFSLSQEAIKPLLENETYLTEQQLSDLGITTSEQINIAAKLNTKSQKMSNSKKEKTTLQKIMALINGDKPTSKILFDSNTNEVDFPELSEEDKVKIGDKATIDGKPADGKVVMADERVFIFADGILEDILEKVDEQELDEAVEKLIEEHTSLQEKHESLQAKYDALVTENEANKKIINKIKSFESKIDVNDKKEKGKGEPKGSKLSTAIANLKKK